MLGGVGYDRTGPTTILTLASRIRLCPANMHYNYECRGTQNQQQEQNATPTVMFQDVTLQTSLL